MVSPCTPTRATLTGLASVMLGGCFAASHPWDLARGNVYRSPTFRAARPKPLAVCVLGMLDRREKPAPQPDDVHQDVLLDARWPRPPTEMLQEVLYTEVQRCGLYKGMVKDPRQADIIIDPALVTFHCVEEEGIAYNRSLATIAIAIQVAGPADPAGNRQIWLDREFRVTTRSDLVPFQPPPVHVIAAEALTELMAWVLEELAKAEAPKAPNQQR